MTEKNRQLVVFGNFEHISFENISALNELKDEFRFSLVAQEETQPFGPGPELKSQINFGPPIIRPAFVSADKKISMFFGTKRIHIEENETDDDSYNSFIEKAKKMVFGAVAAYNLQIDRIAINGVISTIDSEYSTKVFKKYFKENDFCNVEMDDWGFRINSKSKDHKNRPLNRIVTAQLRRELVGSQSNKVLYLSYDYNTFPGQRFDSVDELNQFIIDGMMFRSKILYE